MNEEEQGEEEALERLGEVFRNGKGSDYADDKYLQRISDEIDIMAGKKKLSTPTLLEIAKGKRKFEELDELNFVKCTNKAKKRKKKI
jgi:hypothetical protein